MVKKKIIIFSHGLEIGGAEKALLGLLHSFDYEHYDVDLFLMRHAGELMPFIPEEINLLPEIDEYACLAVPISQVLKRKKIGVLYGRIKGKYKAKKCITRKAIQNDNGVWLEYSHKYTCRYMPEINDTEYDLAISFLTPHYFVAEKVRAKKKLAWIHTDYSKVQVDEASELLMWDKYNHVISISDAATESFLKMFPTLKDKTMVIENILPKELVNYQKGLFSVQEEMPPKGIRLLSIGRYCVAKNFDNVPEICSKLLKRGLDVYWYIIGFGSDENLIKEKICQFGVEDRVIMLGKKDNPYPYIDACDLYVQPSRYEGKSVTVREAQMLGKPVIITNYSTAKSQLEDGVDGIIVPLELEGCIAGIAEILGDKDRMNQLADNCRCRNYSNAPEIQKIYQLV